MVKLLLKHDMMSREKARRNEEQINSEIDKAISRYSEHLMSDSKWVRLIDKLVENAHKVMKVGFKKVQHDRIGQLYLNENTKFGFDYWPKGFEGHNSFGGWLTYREIEFLVFPKTVDVDRHLEQDLVYIEEMIKSIGQFSLESDENELKLNCYKK